jgi:hypothetical protein
MYRNCWLWCHKPRIPALTLGRLGQKNFKFESSLGYIARPCLKTKRQKNKKDIEENLYLDIFEI